MRRPREGEDCELTLLMNSCQQTGKKDRGKENSEWQEERREIGPWPRCCFLARDIYNLVASSLELQALPVLVILVAVPFNFESLLKEDFG